MTWAAKQKANFQRISDVEDSAGEGGEETGEKRGQPTTKSKFSFLLAKRIRDSNYKEVALFHFIS